MWVCEIDQFVQKTEVPVYFRCYGERRNTVLLWRSKTSPEFPSASVRRVKNILGWTVPLSDVELIHDSWWTCYVSWITAAHHLKMVESLWLIYITIDHQLRNVNSNLLHWSICDQYVSWVSVTLKLI